MAMGDGIDDFAESNYEERGGSDANARGGASRSSWNVATRRKASHTSSSLWSTNDNERKTSTKPLQNLQWHICDSKEHWWDSEKSHLTSDCILWFALPLCRKQATSVIFVRRYSPQGRLRAVIPPAFIKGRVRSIRLTGISWIKAKIIVCRAQ